jgi:hypothetical protein
MIRAERQSNVYCTSVRTNSIFTVCCITFRHGPTPETQNGATSNRKWYSRSILDNVEIPKPIHLGFRCLPNRRIGLRHLPTSTDTRNAKISTLSSIELEINYFRSGGRHFAFPVSIDVGTSSVLDVISSAPAFRDS